MPRAAAIGLGAMGGGIAANLLRAGFDLAVYDLNPDRVAALRAAGARAATSPGDATSGADFVLTCLPKHEDVLSVVHGPDGVLAAAHAGQVLVDTSTSLPAQARSLAAAAQERGVRFLDASISGTGATVKERDLTLLVGGDADDVDACRALFAATAKSVHHVGPAGAGALAKLVVNVAVVGNRLALAEALSFGVRAGMEPDTVLSVLKDGSSYSRAMDLKGDKMVRHAYQPESTLAASIAGAELLLSLGRDVDAPLFLASLYAQIARVASGLGYAESDPASVYEALLHLGGREPEA